jgi:predicted aconitase
MQDTSYVAAEATTPQTEIVEHTPALIEKLCDELQTLETECSNLYAKLYKPSTGMSAVYTGPPYMEREKLRNQIANVEKRKDEVKTQLGNYAMTTGMKGEYF